MKGIHILIGLLGSALCWTACSEEGIQGYSSNAYIYFNKSINDSTEFSFAYEPELTEGTVTLKLNTISKLENYDRAFSIKFLADESTAKEGRDFAYSDKDWVVKANDSIAYINIMVKKNAAISGTSVRIVDPPIEISLSENAPTVGFAVIPDKPSEPPHFIPIISSDARIGSRLNEDA